MATVAGSRQTTVDPEAGGLTCVVVPEFERVWMSGVGDPRKLNFLHKFKLGRYFLCQADKVFVAFLNQTNVEPSGT